LPLPKLVYLNYLPGSNDFKIITVLLVHVIAAKPHNANIERLIGKRNILKSINCHNLHVETKN